MPRSGGTVLNAKNPRATAVIEQDNTNSGAGLGQSCNVAPDKLSIATSWPWQFTEAPVKPFAPAALRFKCARSGGAGRLSFQRSGQSQKYRVRCPGAAATPNPSLKRRANSAPSGPRGATSFILHRAGLPSRRWLPLSSNVRQRRELRATLQQSQRLSA